MKNIPYHTSQPRIKENPEHFWEWAGESKRTQAKKESDSADLRQSLLEMKTKISRREEDLEKGEAKLFSRFLKETGASNILIIIAYF